jgi:hypothetical protein
MIGPSKCSNCCTKAHITPWPWSLTISTFAREKMDTVASKMEDVAKSTIRVLSGNLKNATGSTLARDAPIDSTLDTACDCKTSKTFWNDSGGADPPSSHTLSMHLSANDQQIRHRNQSGSAVLSSPAGSMLVAVGKQIQLVTCLFWMTSGNIIIKFR